MVNDDYVGLPEKRLEELSPVGRQVFVQCAESCKRALNEYANDIGMVRKNPLFACLLRAIAPHSPGPFSRPLLRSDGATALRRSSDAARRTAQRARLSRTGDPSSNYRSGHLGV